MAAKSDPLVQRFGPDSGVDLGSDAPPVQQQMARRCSVRSFRGGPIPLETLRRLAALALCAPTKSDLQQCDIIIVDAPDLKENICSLLAGGPLGQAWTRNIPSLLVFCGNNDRQRRIHAMRQKPFANDHLDAFFNAAVDAAIAMSAFVVAAEAEGLGVCPISAVRDHAETVSELLDLPKATFPVAGLAVGYPDEAARISFRLPLSVSVHVDCYSDVGLEAAIEQYDMRRRATQPYEMQRLVERFGTSDAYGWSEDKARQYARPERADFGKFVRHIGFNLD